MTKNIRIITAVAVFAVIASVVSIGAYFTGTITKTNTFTVGNVDMSLTENNWDPSLASSLKQGEVLSKDPVVKNTGQQDEYVFIEVSVPLRDIYTYDPITGQRKAKKPTPLFQINKGRAAYTGTNTVNNGWILANTVETENSVNYAYAYGTATKLTKVKPGTTLPALFDSVTYCYAVEGQGLDTETMNIGVTGYAIQTENITSEDAVSPAEVWNVVHNEVSEL